MLFSCQLLRSKYNVSTGGADATMVWLSKVWTVFSYNGISLLTFLIYATLSKPIKPSQLVAHPKCLTGFWDVITSHYISFTLLFDRCPSEKHLFFSPLLLISRWLVIYSTLYLRNLKSVPLHLTRSEEAPFRSSSKTQWQTNRQRAELSRAIYYNQN